MNRMIILAFGLIFSKEPYQWHELYAPANVPNWVPAIVAAWAGIMALRTLKAIEKQASTMTDQLTEMKSQTLVGQTAAHAALLNAQAVINAERGRLLFEVEKTLDRQSQGVAVFKIYAVNFGRSPAEILGISTPSQHVVEFANSLSIPPKYKTETLPSMRFLSQGSKLYVGDFSPSAPGFHGNDVIKLAEAGVPVNAQNRIAYGEIRYRDGVSDEVRHSRYCFRYERFPLKDIGGWLVPAGPREYNECT
jgi:hypothetical protein